eukprot:g6050.t1
MQSDRAAGLLQKTETPATKDWAASVQHLKPRSPLRLTRARKGKKERKGLRGCRSRPGRLKELANHLETIRLVILNAFSMIGLPGAARATLVTDGGAFPNAAP